jgi:hypothetical protein
MWTLKHAEKYFIERPKSLEWVQVDIQSPSTKPRLHVLPSTIPRAFWVRLDTDVLRKLCLWEKQALNALAENVVVLAGKPRQLL